MLNTLIYGVLNIFCNSLLQNIFQGKCLVTRKWYQSTPCWGRHKLDGKRGVTVSGIRAPRVGGVTS